MITIDTSSDFLLVVDVQTDFVTGSLAVPDATDIIPVVNTYMEKIKRRGFSRDMHPENHSSFKDQGGPWPPHCVTGTPGSDFARGMGVAGGILINKGADVDKDAYSAFDGTGLGTVLIGFGITRLFVCGLATDYCVKATVLDALKLYHKIVIPGTAKKRAKVEKEKLEVYLLTDAIKAVNVKPGDGADAIKEMIDAGAIAITLGDLK